VYHYSNCCSTTDNIVRSVSMEVVPTHPESATSTTSIIVENDVVISSSSSSSSSSFPLNSNNDSNGFVVVKNAAAAASATTTASTTSKLSSTQKTEEAVEEEIKLSRMDVPNHPVKYNPSSSSFLQRLRTTRQILGHRASDVWNAATPALSIAGQAVKTAATHAAVVASSSYETYEATSTIKKTSAETPLTTANNPYDHSPSPQKGEEEEDEEGEEIVEVSTSFNQSNLAAYSSTSGSINASSSFRGRYSAPAPEKKTEKQHEITPTKSSKTANSLLQQALGLPPKQHQQPSARRVGAVRPTFTRSNSGGLLPISPFRQESSAAGIRSQTALILQSSAGPHMQTLLASLEPWEHVMLLGPGIMGVNLKDCYHGGVYVDYCVPNGNAEKSGVVQIGDILVKVGEVNVRKLSIKEVPGIIAKQPRPTVIVLSRKHLYPEEQETNPVDKALATILNIQTRIKDERERSIASMPFTEPRYNHNDSTNTTPGDAVSTASDYYEDDQDSATANNCNDSIDQEFGRDDEDDRSVVSSSNASAMSLMSPSDLFYTPRSSNTTSARSSVPKSVQRSLAAYASRRQLEMSFYSIINRTHGSMDEIFCQTMKDGLRALLADARCLPFFASHLTKQEALYDNVGGGNSTNNTATSANTAKLMLLLETLAFYELWAVIPPQRRWHHASRVAQKFLLNDQPVLDVRPDIPRDILKGIEQTLQSTREDVPRDIFIPVQSHMEQAFCGTHFASFIMGENFARMRAYISGSPVYSDVPLEVFFQSLIETNGSRDAKNYMQYMMVHLVSSEANRGAGLAAALFVKRILETTPSEINDKLHVQLYSQLWNVYLSPTGGTLSAYQKSMSKDTSDALIAAREHVWSILSKYSRSDRNYILEGKVKESLHKLTEELIYEYAANVYPRFKMDRLHDLLFREVVDIRPKNLGPPPLAKGCISRLLRSAKFPRCISTHRPHRSAMVPVAAEADEPADSNSYANAEFAVVFGSDPTSATAIRRFCAIQMGVIPPPFKYSEGNTNAVAYPLPPRVQSVEELPTMLEDYAALNPGRFIKRPMENFQQVCTRSEDGWDIYISNFTIPHASADYPTNCLHGVSLVLYRSSPNPVGLNDTSDAEEPASKGSGSPVFQAIAVEGAERYLTFDIVHKVDQIFKEAPSPSRRQRSGPWSKQSFEGGHTVGISFIANNNVIPAMRQSLCDFLKGISCCEPAGARVSGLADLLGSFSSSDTAGKNIDLHSVLRPYLESGSKEWIHRPLSDQAKLFEDQCVRHLLKCLSPTAFGLAFLTVLLEQKVIFVSSRRTILLSAVTALSKLIAPLEWPHLTVPTVPSHVAVNLIHYPVPFLIGLCSQDKDNQEISNVPKDITVVDLDLGRVVLGEKYASSGDSQESSSELRLQVINLAEELGAHLGSIISPEIWRCEDPLYVSSGNTNHEMTEAGNVCQSVRSFCQEFIAELTAGVDSCCVWIEEGDLEMKQESMVLFDEDRFFHLKDLRSKHTHSPLVISEESGEAVGKFAIGLDEFDLILETFLRGQAMSAFISSRAKESMAYW
jgi:hypothetical protein